MWSHWIHSIGPAMNMIAGLYKEQQQQRKHQEEEARKKRDERNAAFLNSMPTFGGLFGHMPMGGGTVNQRPQKSLGQKYIEAGNHMMHQRPQKSLEEKYIEAGNHMMHQRPQPNQNEHYVDKGIFEKNDIKPPLDASYDEPNYFNDTSEILNTPDINTYENPFMRAMQRNRSKIPAPLHDDPYGSTHRQQGF